jgi:hypothetical protein
VKGTTADAAAFPAQQPEGFSRGGVGSPLEESIAVAVFDEQYVDAGGTLDAAAMPKASDVMGGDGRLST